MPRARMTDLDTFTRAYIECALWSSNDESDPETGGEPLDANYDEDDIADETLDSIIADCKAFQDDNAVDLSAVGPGSAGHDFWLTRNGNGAGFWDRGLGKLGDRLSAACKPYGSCDLYVGDDGKIYIA